MNIEKNPDLQGIRPSVAEPERKDAPIISLQSGRKEFHWATRDRLHAEVVEQVKEIYKNLLVRGRPFTT